MKFNKKGFTIVELVIVIAVIAILAAVLIPTFSSVTQTAKQSAALQQAKSALDSVIALTGGILPDGTLFSVTDSEDGKVDYNFEYKNNAIQTNIPTDLAKITDRTLPTPAGTNATNKKYYAIYVSSKCFDGSPDGSKALEKTEALILSVLQMNAFKAALKVDIIETAPVQGTEYYDMKVYSDTGTTEIPDVEFRVYYSVDINETLVVFVG